MRGGSGKVAVGLAWKALTKLRCARAAKAVRRRNFHGLRSPRGTRKSPPPAPPSAPARVSVPRSLRNAGCARKAARKFARTCAAHDLLRRSAKTRRGDDAASPDFPLARLLAARLLDSRSTAARRGSSGGAALIASPLARH
jgi:hypothetical protein